MTWRVIADEHVKRIYVSELRAHGFEVEWVDGGYEAGNADEDHLERAAETGAVILSNDADFVRRHDAYDHGGLVLYDDQSMPVSTFIRGIKRIERFVPRSELAGNVVWLDSWVD